MTTRVSGGSGGSATNSAPTPTPRFNFPSGSYIIPMGGATATTSAVIGNGVARVAPFFIPQTLVLARLGGEVTVIGDVSSKVRLGIWADNGAGMPGVVMAQGQIAGDSATVQDFVASVTLPRGWYWGGGGPQAAGTTQPTIRVTSAGIATGSGGFLISSGLTIPSAGAGVTGVADFAAGQSAYASPWTAVQGQAVGVVPRIFFKLA